MSLIFHFSSEAAYGYICGNNVCHGDDWLKLVVFPEGCELHGVF